MNSYDSRRALRLAQERRRLMNRLAVIDAELMANVPSLVTRIAVEQNGPLTLVEFVFRAFESGYTPKGKAHLANLVYLSLFRLVEQGVMTRDPKGRGYVLSQHSKRRVK